MKLTETRKDLLNRLNKINNSYSITVKATNSKLNDLKKVEKIAQKRLSRLALAFS